jgi:signal transduction histidine kinase
MGLFNKIRSLRFWLFAFLLIQFLGIGTIILHKQTAAHESDKQSSSRIESLLRQSLSYFGTSLNLAEQKAKEALRLARIKQNPEYMVDSWLLLGKIKGIQGDNTNALIWFLQAQELAEKSNYPKGICEATIETGNVYYTWGEYDKSLPYFQKADTLAAKNSFHQQHIDALNYLGKYYRTKGNFERSILFFHTALEISRKLRDYPQIALTLNHIGKYYIGEGKLNLALQSYLEAFNACEHFNDKIIYAEVCNHLGGLYLQINQYEKALEYHRKALAFRNVINNPEGIAKSYNNIGKAYLELKYTDSAFFYFLRSLELCKSTGYKKGTVKALTNLGKVFTIESKPGRAREYLLQAFTIASEAGYDVGIAESSLALGNFYQSQHQADKAIFYYQTSLAKISKTSFDEIIHDNYQGLYRCYLDQENYPQALKYHVLLSDIEKKLLNVENNRQIALLHIAFDSERKEKDNQVLRKDNELKEMTIKRKTVLLWLIVVVLSFSIVLCFLTYRRFIHKRIANTKLEKLNLQILRQNTELEKLNKELELANHEKDKLFSIIAHELRNPLYWFQNLAEMLSKKYQTMPPEKVQKTLSALDESAKNAFHLMDNLLHWSRSKLKRITPRKAVCPLNTFVCETLLMYETILQHKEISLHVNIPQTIRVYADTDLLSCIVRNLVSNAIKYTPVAGKIIIEGVENDTDITVMVSDSGTGMAGESIAALFHSNDYISKPGLMEEKGSGLGLKLCKEFVELNDGTLWLTSEEGKGTKFFFTISKAMVLVNQ